MSVLAHELVHVAQHARTCSGVHFQGGTGEEEADANALEARVDDEFDAELAALAQMLKGFINRDERAAILAILSDWEDPLVILEAWDRLGEGPLDRFLRKLTPEDYASYPSAILASVVAVPEGDRAVRISRLAGGPIESSPERKPQRPSSTWSGWTPTSSGWLAVSVTKRRLRTGSRQCSHATSASLSWTHKRRKC